MLKALIVEDNRLMQDTLRGLFKTRFSSMIVEQASDGKEALEKAASFKPDLIIMDIRLPDGSGLELTREIKSTNPQVRVLILTGNDYPEYKEMAALYGADGFLMKGEGSREILAVVESFFPKSGQSTG